MNDRAPAVKPGPNATSAPVPTPDPQSALLDLLHANWGTQAIAVAARLELPDHIARARDALSQGGGGVGARGADAAYLTRVTHTHEDTLRRLLDALVTLGVLTRDAGVPGGAPPTYALSPTGELLRGDHPRSLRSWALWWGAYQWPVWERLMHSVQTGEPARPLVVKARSWEHLSSDAQAAEVFNRAMSELTAIVAAALVERVSFADDTLICDVGGGRGTLLTAILAHAPRARGVVLDLAHVRAGAEAHLSDAGMQGRARFECADALISVPGGATTYVLKSVLHDFDDAQAARLLDRLGAALAASPTTARLLVLERLLPDAPLDAPDHRSTARSDLHMLLAHGGRERSAGEMRALLAGAGLRVDRTQPLTMAMSVLECRRAPA